MSSNQADTYVGILHGHNSLQGVAKVEYLALQVMSRYRTSPGPLFGYQSRWIPELADHVQRRQSEAMNEVYKIFYPLIEKVKKVDVDEDSMNFIRAWWRTEVVVRFCEGDEVSFTGEVALKVLNPELYELGGGELQYKETFILEDMWEGGPPSIPSENTDPSTDAFLAERKAFDSIISRIRGSEKQSSLKSLDIGTTLPVPPTTLDQSAKDTVLSMKEKCRARQLAYQRN